MNETFLILNRMLAAGVLEKYALCGAVAAFEYIEPTATRDLDVTAAVVGSGLLVSLSPITDWLQREGYPVVWDQEGLMIGGRPVQFMFPADPLDLEALDHPHIASDDAISIPIWKAEYLMAKCLQVGRPKDHNRLLQFLSEAQYDKNLFCQTLRKFALVPKWQSFRNRFEVNDVCDKGA